MLSLNFWKTGFDSLGSGLGSKAKTNRKASPTNRQKSRALGDGKIQSFPFVFGKQKKWDKFPFASLFWRFWKSVTVFEKPSLSCYCACIKFWAHFFSSSKLSAFNPDWIIVSWTDWGRVWKNKFISWFFSSVESRSHECSMIITIPFRMIRFCLVQLFVSIP